MATTPTALAEITFFSPSRDATTAFQMFIESLSTSLSFKILDSLTDDLCSANGLLHGRYYVAVWYYEVFLSGAFHNTDYGGTQQIQQ